MDPFTKKIIVAGVSLLVIFSLYSVLVSPWIVLIAQRAQEFFGITPPEEEKEYTYTKGLRVLVSVINGTSNSELTSGVEVYLYDQNADPFAYESEDEPIAQATYSSTDGAWRFGGISAGTYLLVVKSASDDMAPVSTLITVEGTDEKEKIVWAEPGTITLYTLPTLTVADWDVANLTSSEGAIDHVHCTYDGTHEGINGTDSGAYGQGDYWRISFEITVSAGETNDKVLPAPIRIYFTDLSDIFDFDKVVVDGKEYTTLHDDNDGSDDGYTGLYITVNEDWKEGETHTIYLYLTQISTEGSDATGHDLVVKIVGAFNVLNEDDFRTSTFKSLAEKSVTVPCKDV